MSKFAIDNDVAKKKGYYPIFSLFTYTPKGPEKRLDSYHFVDGFQVDFKKPGFLSSTFNWIMRKEDDQHAKEDLTEADVLNNFDELKGEQDLKIQSMQTSTQKCGFFPLDEVKAQMKEILDIQNQDWKSARDFIPSILKAAFYYNILPDSQKGKDKYQVEHQVLEFCTKAQSGKFFRFVVDRDQRQSSKFGFWASKVNLLYLKQANSCELDSKEWLVDEMSETYILKGSLKLDHQPAFQDLIQVSFQYIREFPIYNLFYNCQHFASNLFNHFTGGHVDFATQDLMQVHSLNAKDVQEESKLKWISDNFLTKKIPNAKGQLQGQTEITPAMAPLGKKAPAAAQQRLNRKNKTCLGKKCQKQVKK